MTIELPRHIEDSIIAKVHSGLFPSMDAAMTEAARLLLERIERDQAMASSKASDSGQGFIGALRDDADLLDQAVAHAMKVREERPWRLNLVE